MVNIAEHVFIMAGNYIDKGVDVGMREVQPIREISQFDLLHKNTDAFGDLEDNMFVPGLGARGELRNASIKKGKSIVTGNESNSFGELQEAGQINVFEVNRRESTLGSKSKGMGKMFNTRQEEEAWDYRG